MSNFEEAKPPNQHINGRRSPDSDHHHRSPAPSLLSSLCYSMTLKFVDVCYRVKLDNTTNNKSTTSLKELIRGGGCRSTDGISPRHESQERTILHGITGVASPGEVLAVLGPSGSGKSTLLNALAGRVHGHALTGSILANGQNLTRPVLRRTGFVAQDDVLYPHLTVRETLVFCALLRLPTSLTRRERAAAAEDVMEELGLCKCENTIIGNAFVRGVSGGERKRVSIAHEMLVNPSLLILDEPTSGLDSTAAFRLATTLVTLAKKGGKTVVASLHQPSSRLFQMVDTVLLLSEGRPLYFGNSAQAMNYFNSVGYSPSFPMNPADFLLDLANGVCQLDGSTIEREKSNARQTLISAYNTNLGPKVKALCSETSNGDASTASATGKRSHNSPKQHITIWFNHFTILLQRSLKERRHESFNSLRVLQVSAAALLCGTMWWHSDARDVQDRLGLLFFISIFWGVFPSFNATFAFPQDRAVFLKERGSGMYTLSSYFMARIVGDLPMELILPTLFLSMTYWMTGLKPEPGAFILTLAVVLLYVLVAQGLGLALGAIIMDAKRASTIVTITMLAFVLTGGFYVHKMPECFHWIKYVSITFYAYKLLIAIQYGRGEAIWSIIGCSHVHHESNVSGSCKYLEDDVLRQISPIASVAILGTMFFGYRLIAYFALKRIRQ
ncbi:hypothetical protein V2J09_000646 [Rumex salicifolius]